MQICWINIKTNFEFKSTFLLDVGIKAVTWGRVETKIEAGFRYLLQRGVELLLALVLGTSGFQTITTRVIVLAPDWTEDLKIIIKNVYVEELFVGGNLAEHEDLAFNLHSEVDLPVLHKVEVQVGVNDNNNRWNIFRRTENRWIMTKAVSRMRPAPRTAPSYGTATKVLNPSSFICKPFCGAQMTQ